MLLSKAKASSLKFSFLSLDPPFCEICMEEKSRIAMFEQDWCSHLFCSDCISKYITAKVEDTITSITCPFPNCESVLQPEICKELIPDKVFDRWMNALCESAIVNLKKCYCPFKDCSETLVDDGGEVVTKSECPNCRRLFCAQCKVSWHTETSCEDFQILNEDERGTDDSLLMKLAKEKKWSRCPNCMFYIEKIEGCRHIECRCGIEFCYSCRSIWSDYNEVDHDDCEGEDEDHDDSDDDDDGDGHFSY